MIKAEWVYSIVKALEARLQYVTDDAPDNEEKDNLGEALDYFKRLEI